ncbi:MAG: PaaI family thioesterase [Acidimicrobiales bacterium]
MSLQIPPNCDLTLGLRCLDKSEPGVTVWSMRVDERFLNPAGLIQGGFLAALLDSAMGASAVTGAGAGRKVTVMNTEMKVSFLRAATLGDELICTAKVLKPGSVISFLEGRVVNQRDELVATASSSYLIRERTE